MFKKFKDKKLSKSLGRALKQENKNSEHHSKVIIKRQRLQLEEFGKYKMHSKISAMFIA